MVEVLGPAPKQMLQRWSKHHSGVDVDGGVLEGLEPMSDSLHDILSKGKPESMSTQDASVFKAFARTILQFDPENRPSAEELFQHPWLQVAE